MNFYKVLDKCSKLFIIVSITKFQKGTSMYYTKVRLALALQRAGLLRVSGFVAKNL